jgi:hypothetical protein
MVALFKYRQRGKNKLRAKRARPLDRTPCGGIIRIRFEGFRADGMPPRNLSLYIVWHPCRTWKKSTTASGGIQAFSFLPCFKP